MFRCALQHPHLLYSTVGDRSQATDHLIDTNRNGAGRLHLFGDLNKANCLRQLCDRNFTLSVCTQSPVLLSVPKAPLVHPPTYRLSHRLMWLY